MSSSSIHALLLFWVSSSVASRAMPLAVTWYNPESGSSDSNSAEPMMEKSTSILYGDQPPLTSLRLDEMEANWLQNTLEPGMDETPADTESEPSSEQQLQQPRTLYTLEEQRSKKRGDGHSLSVVNPVDVIRQSMLMGAARERMRQNQNQIEANAQLLNQIGKRQIWHRQPRWMHAWDASKAAFETSRTQAS